MRFAGRLAEADGSFRVEVQDPEKMRPALAAYHDGRLFLHSHMTAQCPFPVGRAAKQQIFRSFSGNAVQVACMLKSSGDILAEVEWSGPREATEIVTEIAAAREAAPTSLAEFRRNRAICYSGLGTLPGRFEDYLANFTDHFSARRAYMKELAALDAKLIQTQSYETIAEHLLKLRLPDTVFLLFHVDQDKGHLVLVDMSSGVVGPWKVNFGEHELRAINQDYKNGVTNVTTRKAALDKLTSRYAELLGPVLEPLMRFLPDKHVKIFSRLQMNAVPFHALRFGGKYLIKHCQTISYGQTLGLFLATHSTSTEQYDAALRCVVGTEVPWYDLILNELRRAGNDFVEDRRVGWPQLMGSLAAKPARDVLFACHGRYDASNMDDSYLDLGSEGDEGKVSFSRVFEGLDLRGCRSIIMGACESGLARAEISAEYVGLPSAMLSSGARYVIGALWTIPQLETAVLVKRYLELIKDETVGVCAALCAAQRELMTMTRDQLFEWVRAILAQSPELNDVLKQVAEMDEYPFAHPYHWAGLQAVGDI